MKSNSPIFIAAPTRSGTTMLAWLLHLHGAWIGEAKITKAPETNSLVGTENIHIKKYLRSLSRSVSPEEIRQDLLFLVETDGPWLVKTAQLLLKWDRLHKAFPNAKWLLPSRQLKDIVDSAMRHPGMKHRGRDAHTSIVLQHVRFQHLVAQHCNALWVDMNALATRDMLEAKQVVDFCGLKFDTKLWDGWVKPEMWHGSS